MNDRIPDNEVTWRSVSDDQVVNVGYISSNGVKYGMYSEPIYISIQDEDYDNLGIALTTEQAREFAAHLIVLADDYDALKPKEPTRAERWAAAPIGTIITGNGRPFVEGSSTPYRVKIGADVWASSLYDGGNALTWPESMFHPDWDIVGTNS